MQIRVTDCDSESGVLKVKCSGVFGRGSLGNPAAEKIAEVIEYWIKDHPETLVSGLELDYTEVDYSWGDGPVSSLIRFLVRGVTKVRFVASSRNYEALKGLLEVCGPVFDFELIRIDTIGGRGVLSNVGLRLRKAATVIPKLPMTQSGEGLTRLTLTQSEGLRRLKPPRRHIIVLEQAISDAGFWRSWTDRLPDEFHVQFGGVQLWNPPAVDGAPPAGTVVSLIFQTPSLVAHLTDADESLQWVVRPIGSENPAIRTESGSDFEESVLEDPYWPFPIDELTLSSDDEIESMIDRRTIDFRSGTHIELASRADPVRLAFLAGPAGLVVRAKALRVVSTTGEMSPEKIIKSYEAWWDYWHDYWERRNSESPMPKDPV
jgi:hypothetical protein